MITPLLLAAGILVGAASPDPAFPAMDSCFIITTADSLGAGFLTDGGVIVTAAHVVEGANAVALETGETTPRHLRGEVVYRDVRADIAVIKPNTAIDLPALHVSSTLPRVGATVYAVGSPIERLVASRGLVVAADSSIIEATAPVDHGSSGGPLLAEDGEVVGVVVQVAAATGNSFSVPGATVETVLAAATSGAAPTADAVPDATAATARVTSMSGWIALFIPLTFAVAVAALLVSLLALRHSRSRARNRIVITLDEE